MTTATITPNLTPELTQELEDCYYGVTDNIHPLVGALKEAIQQDPTNAALQNELKIFENILAHVANSDLGREL